VPHRNVAHRLEVRRGTQCRFIDAIREHGDRAGLVRQACGQFVGRQRDILIVVVDLEVLRQMLDDFGKDGTGDENLRFDDESSLLRSVS
tara:strand:+ start:1638 stop:1904 length:267 start_codon:yes stop_codon:yes gene_type:complete